MYPEHCSISHSRKLERVVNRVFRKRILPYGYLLSLRRLNACAKGLLELNAVRHLH